MPYLRVLNDRIAFDGHEIPTLDYGGELVWPARPLWTALGAEAAGAALDGCLARLVDGVDVHRVRPGQLEQVLGRGDAGALLTEIGVHVFLGRAADAQRALEARMWFVDELLPFVRVQHGRAPAMEDLGADVAVDEALFEALLREEEEQQWHLEHGLVDADSYRRVCRHVRGLYTWLDDTLAAIAEGASDSPPERLAAFRERERLEAEREAREAEERQRAAAEERARKEAAEKAAREEAWERDRPAREAREAAARAARAKAKAEAAERERRLLDPQLLAAEGFPRLVELIRDLEARGMLAPPAPRDGAMAWWGLHQRAHEFSIDIEAADWLTTDLMNRWAAFGWLVSGPHGIHRNVTRSGIQVTVYQFDAKALRAAGLVLPEACSKRLRELELDHG